MAGNSEVLKEYLLSLGFRVDSKSSKTFDTTVTNFDKRVVSLAKGVTAVGVASIGMATLFARSMESLYYSSRKAESTAGALQAAAFGAAQIGIGGNQMKASIEGMASAIRRNPGLTGLLESLGVQSKGRNMSDVMMDLVGKLKSMPHYVGTQYASMFGISEEQLFLMEEGLEKMKAAAAVREQMARDAGVDMDAAAKSGMEYSNVLGRITERLGILTTMVGVKALPAIKAWGQELDEGIAKFTRIIGKVNSGSDLMGMMKTGAMRFNREITDFMGLTGPKAGGKAPGASPQAMPTWEVFSKGAKSLPLGLRNNNPGNLRSWGSAPTAGGFAQFGTSQEGLSAMAGNLLRYQQRGLTSINKIIAAWAPSSENNTSAYIKSVSKQTGYGETDLLNLQDPKVLASLMSAIVKHENGSNPFSMDDINSAVGSRFQKEGITMHQQTTITVHSPDPATAGAQVASKQNSVNAGIVRNLNTVVH